VPANAYPARWFTTFLDTIPAERTRSEVDFLFDQLPLPDYRTVLDLGCGPGRHALESADGPFDAVVSLWASFGWFDAATNQSLLEAMAGVLRPGGRAVLDLYDAAFFERAAPAERLHARGGVSVRERTRRSGDRLHIELEYGDGSRDRFHWQIFRADELAAAAASAGLAPLLACAAFDPATPADGHVPRMQHVFARG